MCISSFPLGRVGTKDPSATADDLFSGYVKTKKPVRMDELFVLAEGEGFEPPKTESESVVLPLD